MGEQGQGSARRRAAGVRVLVPVLGAPVGLVVVGYSRLARAKCTSDKSLSFGEFGIRRVFQLTDVAGVGAGAAGDREVITFRFVKENGRGGKFCTLRRRRADHVEKLVAV